jgi:hypothetical protein
MNLAVTPTKRDQNQHRHLSSYTAHPVFDSHSTTSNSISPKVIPLQSSNVFKLFCSNVSDYFRKCKSNLEYLLSLPPAFADSELKNNKPFTLSGISLDGGRAHHIVLTYTGKHTDVH